MESVKDKQVKSNRFWLIILGGAVIVSAAAALLMWQVPGSHAHIYHNGELTETVNLAAITEPFTIMIGNGSSSNVIAVESGRIRMLTADCPDGSCVRQGWTSGGVTPIVCLPNRVVITLDSRVSEADVDAVTG